jgi:hypothetical protein
MQAANESRKSFVFIGEGGFTRSFELLQLRAHDRAREREVFRVALHRVLAFAVASGVQVVTLDDPGAPLAIPAAGAAAIVAKPGARDATQVLANGGVFALALVALFAVIFWPQDDEDAFR